MAAYWVVDRFTGLPRPELVHGCQARNNPRGHRQAEADGQAHRERRDTTYRHQAQSTQFPHREDPRKQPSRAQMSQGCWAGAPEELECPVCSRPGVYDVHAGHGGPWESTLWGEKPRLVSRHMELGHRCAYTLSMPGGLWEEQSRA